MKNIIMYKAGEQSWIRWIKKRIKHNLNFLALAEGSTGIGKSWAMLRIAYDIDPTFEPRQVAFSFKQVMEIINSEWFMKKKWRVLVFDEAQCDISNRQWQSLTNKLMNYLLSTFRHRNIIMLFTSPYSDFLDSQSMKLVHAKFECKGWTKRTKKSLIRPKILQWNSQLKKFYYHSLYVIKSSKMQKLVTWQVSKPPESLIVPYEKAKLEFTTQLNQGIMRELEAVEKKKLDPQEPKGELNPDSMQPVIWSVAKEGYKRQIDLVEQVGKVMGKRIDLSNLNKNITRMRKKGWDVRQFKEGIVHAG